MTKIVIAGCASCPYYAKCELLADSLERILPSFHVHKILVREEEWETWLSETCIARNWKHTTSPIIWRELVDRGGKGSLIGGSNHFQEYANRYYGQNSDMMSDNMSKISEENKLTLEKRYRLADFKRLEKKCTRICITNATGIAAYNLAFRIADSKIFDHPVELVLYEHPNKGEYCDTTAGDRGEFGSIALGSIGVGSGNSGCGEIGGIDAKGQRVNISNSLTTNASRADKEVNEDVAQLLHGISMELQDCACNRLSAVHVTRDFAEAATNCALAIIMDNIDGEGEQCYKNVNKRFREYGKILNKQALTTCKVIICGRGPLNLKVACLVEATPNLLQQNVVGASQILENQAKGVISGKIKVKCSGVLDLTVWGDSSNPSFLHLDTSVSRLREYAGAVWLDRPWWTVDTDRNIVDRRWAQDQYAGYVSDRTKDILKHYISTKEPAITISSTILTMIDYWWNGSPENQTFSLTVVSKGWYDVPEGVVFSVPVTYASKGYWSVREDIELSADVRSKFKDIVKELEKQKTMSIIPDEDTSQVVPLPEQIRSEIKDPPSVLIDDVAGASDIATPLLSPSTTPTDLKRDGNASATLQNGEPGNESNVDLPSGLANEVADDLTSQIASESPGKLAS